MDDKGLKKDIQGIKNKLYKIIEYKTMPTEYKVANLIRHNPELILDSNINESDFHNPPIQLLYKIIYHLIVKKKYKQVTDLDIAEYYSNMKDNKIKNFNLENFKFHEEKSVENYENYCIELKKWSAIYKMIGEGFILENFNDYNELTIEELYDEYEVKLNNIFSKATFNISSYKLSDGIDELIEELDKGEILGLPYNNLPILTSETGGQYLGAITLLGGISNVGKSTVARTSVIPSIIKYDEKIVIMINEDSFQKWQREMLVWICNNIFNYDIQKHIVRNGKYTDEVKEKLYEASNWLKEKTENGCIIIIPLLQYRTSLVLKIIKKYNSLGYKYFMLDTFKMDAGRVTNNSWLEMQQNMVNIKDIVKTENLNVHILITFQLEKGSSISRYYTQNNIGLAKNIVDVASTCIMVRDLFNDEYENEKNEIKVYKLEGKNGKTKIPIRLDKNKRYQIFFIVKNQEGSANNYQIVVEHDKSRNLLKEVGVTSISPNF